MNEDILTLRRHLMNRPRRRVAAALASVAALSLILASCGGPTEDDGAKDAAESTATIRVAHTNSVSNLAIWAADSEGMFDKHGVDVKLESLNTTSVSQVPALMGKQFDIAIGLGPVLINAADKGIDIVAVSNSVTFSEQTDPSTAIIAGKDSGIKTPKDLEGKRLAAASLAGNINLATMKWLTDQGVDTKKVKVVQANSSNMPDLMKSGKIDASESTMPFSGVLLADGNVNLGYPLSSVADPVTMSFWISDRTWAKKNSEALKKFRAALDEAATWIAANKEEGLTLALTKANLPAKYKDFISLPTYTTKMEGKDLQAWADAMNKVSGFTTNKNMDDLIVIDD